MTNTPLDMTRSVLEDRRSALIRAEVLAGEQRRELERAARDAITKLGYSIDAVSDATGLTPAELRQIASQPVELGLDELAGAIV